MEYQGIWFNGGKEEASKETRERVAQVGCYIPIILVTWEIEAGGCQVQGQSQKFSKNPVSKLNKLIKK